jgi:hypothetical protein
LAVLLAALGTSRMHVVARAMRRAGFFFFISSFVDWAIVRRRHEASAAMPRIIRAAMLRAMRRSAVPSARSCAMWSWRSASISSMRRSAIGVGRSRV